MKRLVIRLSALIGVLAVGTAAIVQAQRSLSRAEAEQPQTRVEPVAPQTTANAEKNSLRREQAADTKSKRPATNPFSRRTASDRTADDRYADDRTADDRYAGRYPASASAAGEASNVADATPRNAEPALGEFPDAQDVRGLADAQRVPAGEVRNPFAGATAGDGLPASSTFDAEDANVRLVAANEAEDRYSPGSIRNEPRPAPVKNSNKKPADPEPDAAPAAERYPAGFFGADRGAAAQNDLRPPDEGAPLAERLPPADGDSETAAEGDSQDSLPSAAERIAAAGQIAGEDGGGRPGGKHLEGLQTPSLTLEKTAPKEIQVGKPAKFEVRVRNAGQVLAQGVEIYEQVPQGT
ncbi:MAG TPA: hypothetical protein VFU81_04400, partial [Thermomicrobiales bacterium]|nr:hypothetical protein [Thermomicrobiales bacterium]